MATTRKFLSVDGLKFFVSQLYARGFNGMGLSHVDFTEELKEKLESSASTANIKALNDKIEALQALVNADSNGAIDRFNEIVDFLAGIGDDTTLKGMFSNIAVQIAEAKKAADEAQKALDAFKETVYTKDETDEAFIRDEDLVPLSEAEINAAIAPMA